MLADFFNNSDAQTKLGYNYFNGILFNKNIKKAINYFNKAANKENSPTIAVIGDYKVGKTSFINRLMKNIDDPLLFPTDEIRSYYLPMTLDDGKRTFIRILDTPNIDYLRNNIRLIPDDTKLVVFIFDRTKEQSFNCIDQCIELIRPQITTKLIILSNKIDINASSVSFTFGKRKAQQVGADYYEISALNSTNIEMVCDIIYTFINKAITSIHQEEITIKHFRNENPQIKTIVIGSSGCGKTSFIRRLGTNSFSDLYLSAPGAIIDKFILDLCTLNITDTPGQERYRDVVKMFIRTQRLFIIMFSITDRGSFANIDNWYKLIDDNAESSYKILLFGNKVDLEAERKVSYNEALAKAISLNAEYIEISCVNGNNFNLALRLIKDTYISIQGNALNPSKTIDINDGNHTNRNCSC